MNKIKRILGNEVMLAIIALTGILFLVAFFSMISGIKRLSSANTEVAALPDKIAHITIKSNAYREDQYRSIAAGIPPDKLVSITSTVLGISIAVSDISNEELWRHTVADLLASDRNLHTRSICGSVTSNCSGHAMTAEIEGYRQFAELE